MQSKQTRYYFLITALIMGGFFALTSCENDQAEVDKLFQKQVAVETGDKVESYLSQNGHVKAKLTAPYMLRYQQPDSPYMEFPRTMHVDFYDTSAVIESTLDCRYAKYVEFDHKVLLRDSVLVISIAKGDTLRTNELWWDQNRQEFYTDKPAHIYQRDKIIFSKHGLKAAQNLTSYTLYSSSGPMLVPNSGMPQ